MSKCGTKKVSCKNKDFASGEADPQNANAGQNAFERHQIVVEEAKQQITVCDWGLCFTYMIQYCSMILKLYTWPTCPKLPKCDKIFVLSLLSA